MSSVCGNAQNIFLQFVNAKYTSQSYTKLQIPIPYSVVVNLSGSTYLYDHASSSDHNFSLHKSVRTLRTCYYQLTHTFFATGLNSGGVSGTGLPGRSARGGLSVSLTEVKSI